MQTREKRSGIGRRKIRLLALGLILGICLTGMGIVPEITVFAADSKTEADKATTAATATATTTKTTTAATETTTTKTKTPVEEHGALRVEGIQLVDKNGDVMQLYGMSTHGIAWFPDYVNKKAFQRLRDDWKTNCVRLALYTDEYNGYCNGGDQKALKKLVKNGVKYATDLGMYVIIDWHVLNDKDPNVYKKEAKKFFKEMSKEYADYDNVIYEICNEPNSGTDWKTIKKYANAVIPVIRENDEDAVIIVGTPTWSQDIDQAAKSPLKYDNVLYALHFYAATHTDWLRDRLESCVKQGLPVFVSEFGTCDASGSGGNDFTQAKKWLKLLDKYDISYCAWNLANKAETSSVIKSSCTKKSGWKSSDLSESGKWLRKYFRAKAK